MYIEREREGQGLAHVSRPGGHSQGQKEKNKLGFCCSEGQAAHGLQALL